VIYALHTSSLQKLCTYRTSTAPIDIAIHAPSSQIAVADLMKSISVLTYTPASETSPNATLKERARHYQTAWSTAVGYVGEDTWLEADAEGNLMLLKQNTAGVTADDRRRLEVVSELRLGEMVNRIRHVDVATTSTAVVVPKAFMATVEGGVYLFGEIVASHLDLLIRLQTSLAPLVESLGGVPFSSYRAFHNQVREAEEPYRFVDGELIEAFLDLAPGLQGEIIESLGPVAQPKGGVEEVREMIEGLRRLH